MAAMAYEPPTSRPAEPAVKAEIFVPQEPDTLRPRPAPVRPKPEPKPEPKLEAVAEVAEEEIVEPKVRSQKEAAPAKPAASVASILDDWASDDED